MRSTHYTAALLVVGALALGPAPAPARAQEPTTSSECIKRGNTRLGSGDYDGALAD